MQRTFFPWFIVLAMLLSFTKISFSQINEDSMMMAKSEEWKVQQKKGLFGLSKPVFGNYITKDIYKIDSPIIRRRSKDSASFDMEITGSGSDIDNSKYVTIQKTKWYKLLLATDSTATSAVFSIASISKEKKQTFLGKMMSKNDEGKNETLSYKRDVPGSIFTGDSSVAWEFFISNFTSGSGQNAGLFTGAASISSGYLKNGEDSLFMQIYSSFSADMVLVNKNGEHLAALKFKQKPITAWIRNDIDSSNRHAIAALFAVIIAIKDF
ncbi:MAG: hypothetical protein ABI691_18445 [Ginsengibacter sp.]